MSRGNREPATVLRLREHDQVVAAALRSATPLPLRFGSTFHDEDEARQVLEDRQAEFLATLDRVRDRVEMTLLILDPLARNADNPTGRDPNLPSENVTTSSSGREYLERRRREYAAELRATARADEMLAAVEAEFVELDIQTARTKASTGEVVGSLAHLVHRSDLRSYRDRVVEVKRKRDSLRIVPSGPWAPYSFV